MKSRDVSKMNRSLVNCKGRVQTLKQKKNKIISPNFGNRFRNVIIQDLEKELKKGRSEQDLVLNYSPPTNEQVMPRTVLDLNIILEDPVLEFIHQQDKEIMGKTICSNNLKSLDDIVEQVKRLKNDLKVRNTRKILDSECFRGVVRSLRSDGTLFQFGEEISEVLSIILIHFINEIEYLYQEKDFLAIFITSMFALSFNKLSKEQLVVISMLFLEMENMLSNRLKEIHDIMNMCSILAMSVNIIVDTPIQYPIRYVRSAYYSNTGMGKGTSSRMRQHLTYTNVYQQFKNRPIYFKEQLFLTKLEFDKVCDELVELFQEFQQGTIISARNDILMTLLFVFQYDNIKKLAFTFGCSNGTASKIISRTLPFLASYFLKEIPNKFEVDSSHSILSKNIIGITDNTLTRTRRPRVEQRSQYNGHYEMHGRLTQLLVDLQGKIISFNTCINGAASDFTSGIYNTNFDEILDGKYCLGDSAYNHCRYVCPGFRETSVKTAAQRVFDKITRDEQQKIENTNGFVKNAKSVDKENVFYHGDEKLFLCICISCGLFNKKREWGYFHPND